MIKIGNYNILRIARFVDFGAYLADDDNNEVLLPSRYVPDDAAVGDEIEVFVYTDSEDRIVAVTDRPYAQVGEFAFLQVAEVNRFGAFLEWGVPKHLFVPFSEQRPRMQAGGIYPVYLYLDHITKRVVASAKVPARRHRHSPRLAAHPERIYGHRRQSVPGHDLRQRDIRPPRARTDSHSSGQSGERRRQDPSNPRRQGSRESVGSCRRHHREAQGAWRINRHQRFIVARRDKSHIPLQQKGFQKSRRETV